MASCEGFLQFYYLWYCILIKSIELVIHNTNPQKESLLCISIACIFILGLIVSYLQLSSGLVFQLTMVINTLLLIITLVYAGIHMVLDHTAKSFSKSLTKAGILKSN
jgi:hypothetical protein